MENGLNPIAVQFAMQLVKLYLVDERQSGIVTEVSINLLSVFPEFHLIRFIFLYTVYLTLCFYTFRGKCLKIVFYFI